MTLKQYTAPTTYPVTLAEVKLHLKIDVADDDALITAAITAATSLAEQATGRSIMSQVWDLTLDEFPAVIELPRIPVVSVTTFSYIDESGATQTLTAGTDYTLDQSSDHGPARIVPAYGKTWPATRAQFNAVAVRYAAGYANAAAVPEEIKAWIKLQIGAMYENRAAVGERVTFTLGFADRLLDRHKVWAL